MTVAVTVSAKTFFHLLSEAPISWSPFGRKLLSIFELNVTVSSSTSSPRVVFPLTVKLLVTVKLLPIVTSLGRPIVNVWSAADVSISFAVPEILKVWLSKSTDPVPVSPEKSKSWAVTWESTYALIDCCVASALALSDVISSSSRIVVIPTKVCPGCPISSWFIVAIPLILMSLPLISS